MSKICFLKQNWGREQNIEQEIVVITGASSGFGKATARLQSAHGAVPSEVAR